MSWSKATQLRWKPLSRDNGPRDDAEALSISASPAQLRAPRQRRGRVKGPAMAQRPCEYRLRPLNSGPHDGVLGTCASRPGPQSGHPLLEPLHEGLERLSVVQAILLCFSGRLNRRLLSQALLLCLSGRFSGCLRSQALRKGAPLSILQGAEARRLRVGDPAAIRHPRDDHRGGHRRLASGCVRAAVHPRTGTCQRQIGRRGGVGAFAFLSPLPLRGPGRRAGKMTALVPGRRANTVA